MTRSGPASSSLSFDVCSLCARAVPRGERGQRLSIRGRVIAGRPERESKRRDASHLFVKDEAAEQRRALLRRQVVEDAPKDHLGEEQLVSTRDLARDAPLLLDDVLARREPEPAQGALAVLELVEVHDRLGLRDLFLGRADLELEGLLGRVLVVEGGEGRVRVQRVRDEARLEDLDALSTGRGRASQRWAR